MNRRPDEPIRHRRWSLPLRVAALRATIHAKLLAVYLVISLLLLSAAGVGLFALNEMNQRAREAAQLQRKIAAYRQLNHDIIAQLYGVSSALLQPEERRFEATLRQLKQFGYDLDRLQFLSKDEMAAMDRIRAEFEGFIEIVTRVVELIRAGRVVEGQRMQLAVATPLADRLERDTNHLVNKAEADMIAGIELANEVYASSRRIVIACGVLSVLLALGLGYVVSRSLIDPIKRMAAMMRQLATGDFSRRVEVANRDELGRLARDMNRTSEELGRLYDQLDAARENAERADREKSRFLASASHDLRQPMHAMTLWVGNFQAALARGDREEAVRAAAAIDTACRDMSASFSAILDLSRFDARLASVELSVVDPAELCRRVVQEFEPVARQKGIELRWRPSKRGPVYTRTDEVVLGRILRNLIGNAVKFCRSGGVLVGCVARGDRVSVHVVDTGPGIARQHWEGIFTEFYQVPNVTRDRQQGVGLGLSIVRKGVQLLAGHAMGFNSVVGRGSRFSLSLPRVPAPTHLPGTLPAASARTIAGAYIAVVDDEPLVLQGLVLWLKNCGCLVVAGESGDALLAQVRQNERIPDVLISDWRLAEDKTGWDVACALEREVGRELPLIFMTGDPLGQIPRPEESLRATWVQKPFDATTLLALLSARLPAREYV